jgi:saccharopine dehydrogenase (NAD+, L-lysine-forming)
MNKVLILGACGGIGSVATRALLTSDLVDSLVLSDYNQPLLEKFCEELSDARVSACSLDVNDQASLKNSIQECDVVVNCVGPFYKYGPPILRAAIEVGRDYVDICDDLDATIAQLELDEMAKEKSVRAIIGMGSSPGLANLLVRFANDTLLDQVEEVDICHVHGGEASEGPAVLKHRIHAMVNEVPVFVDGKFENVMLLEESGARYSSEVDFGEVGVHKVYPYPHPETITLPKYIPNIRKVTNRGSIFPKQYFELTMSHVRNGLASTQPIVVDGTEVVPLEFMVSHLISSRSKLLSDAGVISPAGCLRVEVSGKKDGEDHTYIFLSGSSSDGAGAGTGIPAALGAMLILDGKVTKTGVNPPEAVVDPVDMMAKAGSVVAKLGVATQTTKDQLGGSKIPLTIEHLGPNSLREFIPFEI